MSSPPAANGLPKLDKTLATLQAQVRSLTAQRTLLTTRLLSLSKTRQLLHYRHPLSPPSPPLQEEPSFASSAASNTQQSTIPDIDRVTDSQILGFSLERSKALTKHALVQLHRVAGVTAFTVQDPSSAKDEGHKLERLAGIRIEVFTKKKFEKSVYVLLSLVPSEKDKEMYFTIARHSIPTFLGVSQLANQYLSKKAGIKEQRLDIFVKVLRTRVIRYHRRLAAIEDVKAAAENAGSIGDVTEKWIVRCESVEWDAPVEVVTLKWMNGIQGWLKIEERGKVERVIVKDRKGRRRVEVEALAKGSLKGLAGRIGWV